MPAFVSGQWRKCMQDTPRRGMTVNMPVLALRGMMVFPHMVLHFDVGRPKSVSALEKAMMEDQRIFLVSQRDADVDDPHQSDLCRVGTIAQIKQVLNLPGDSIRVLVEGKRRAVRRRNGRNARRIGGRISGKIRREYGSVFKRMVWNFNVHRV